MAMPPAGDRHRRIWRAAGDAAGPRRGPPPQGRPRRPATAEAIGALSGVALASGLKDLHRHQDGVVPVLRLQCGIEDFRDDILIPDTSIGPPPAIWLAHQSRTRCLGQLHGNCCCKLQRETSVS